MELRHLRYFVAVAERENVSQAALKLHVSQPALSRQLHDLEEELGFPLFERSAKSLRLTGAGQVFLKEARDLLSRVEGAVKAARTAAEGARDQMEVGYAPTLTARFLPQSIREFGRNFPQVRVKLHDLSTEEMLESLRKQGLDLAISVRPASGALRGLQFEELRKEPLLLAVSPGHAFARRRVIPLTDLADQKLLAYSRSEYPDYHEMIEELFARCDRVPRITEEHDGVSSLISGIEAGAGVSIVPESTSCLAGTRLRLLPLTPEPTPLSVGTVVRRGKPARLAEEFCAVLKAFAARPALKAAP